jgi:hypothetical protein
MITFRELKNMMSGVESYEVWMGNSLYKGKVVDSGKFDEMTVIGIEIAGGFNGNICVVDLVE